MTTVAASPVAAPARVSWLGSGPGFLWLILSVTAIPFVLMPASTAVDHPGWPLHVSTRTIIFLASGTHVAASYGFYVDRDIRPTIVRRKGRFIFVPVLAVVASAIFYDRARGEAVSVFIFAYLIWQVFHYTKQNIGILAFSARASGTASPTDLERAAVLTGGWAGIIGSITIATPYLDTPLRHFTWEIKTLGRLTLVGTVILGLLALPGVLATRRPMRVVFFVFNVLFYLPVFLFHNPVAAVSSYALAHGLQYLVMMGYVSRAGRQGSQRIVMPLAVAAIGLLGGWLLKAMQDGAHWGSAAKLIYGAYLGLVMVHFIIDAGIWRLSDRSNRAYMKEHFSFLS